MPWNDNANPGPWGTPPQGGGDPPGNRPRRDPPGGRRPPPPGGGPDFNEFLRRLNDQLRSLFGGAGGQGVRPAALAAFAGVAFLLWMLSGVYFVQASQVGVVTTFGAYTGQTQPGANYHLPAPIQNVELVSYTSLRRIDIGGSSNADNLAQSLMLTGDEQIVDIDFSVQWRVKNARDYLFNLRDQEEGVTSVAESAMREVVGRTNLQALLTTGRGTTQSQTAELMQKILDSYHSGVEVVEVQIRSANPPAEVVPNFQDLARANQDAEALINEGNTYRNKVVNEAKGDAARITQLAQAYREQIVRDAEGDASRFSQIYAEYRRAPGVTRDRLYIETMQRVMARSNKVIVDGRGTTAPIILPPDVFRPRAQTGPTPGVGSSPQTPSGAAQ